MKYILITFLFILLVSFYKKDDARDFHVKVVGIEEVRKFELRFPKIAYNRPVYVAYLQKYYKGHEDEFINLLK